MVALAAASASLAGAAAPPTLSGLRTWATAGSRVAFVATIGGRQGVWVERFGSNRPTRLRARPPAGEEEIDQLAAGPNGSWACLERTVGNTEAYYSVDLVLSSGVSRHVATAGGPTGEGNPPVNSIPQVLGDGSFLGYLHVTAGGVVQLFQIRASGEGRRIANLVDVSAPRAVAVAGGNLAILQDNGSVAVFTTTGQHLSTIQANATSLALTGNRVLVRTGGRRLVIYGMRGGLVHSWPLGATGWTASLAAYGRYAVYLGANKAVRAIRLANGVDRILAGAGPGFFFDGLSLQAPGVVVPLTTQRGKSFQVTLRFLPTAALRKELG